MADRRNKRINKNKIKQTKLINNGTKKLTNEEENTKHNKNMCVIVTSVYAYVC